MFSERRIAAALALLLVAVSLTGCDDAPARPGSDRIKIAFLLPDVQATRYDRFDVPYFAAKVEALCSRCDIIYRNAAELPRTQRFQAAEAIDNGADVLVLDPVDAVAARGIVELAASKDVPVIAYDRLVERVDLAYYVGFDNENIGRIQAAALVQKLQRTGLQTGKIVMINGSHDDHNALLYNKGARSVFDRTQFQLVPEEDFFVPGWSPADAQKFMAEQLRALSPPVSAAANDDLGFVAVYSANDSMAAGAIAAFKVAGIAKLPPISGQDAELEAIQRILIGEQYMTVHKSYREEAERTAEFAVALARGEHPEAPGTVNNGFEDVPTTLAGVTAITRDNLQSTVIDTQLYTIAELCAGRFLGACSAAGLH
jgi:D-xylose transport system substrate-binding protein